MSGEDSALPLIARRSGPLAGTVRPPGDKSISHRALMLGALAVGETSIEGLLEGEDILATVAAMRAFGATATRTGAGAWRISGLGVGGLLEPEGVIDYGNAGTGVRLAMGIAGSHAFATTFTGDGSLVRRPMGRIFDPLRRMGVQVLARSGERLPATVRGPDTLVPIEYRVPVPSAQVKSAVLLAALNSAASPRSSSRFPPATIPSACSPPSAPPSRSRKATMASARSASRAGAISKPQTITVPGDPSSAAFLMVAALIVAGSDVTVENVLLNPTRIGLIETLIEMGGDISIGKRRNVGGEEVGDIRVKASRLKGVTVPAARAPSMIDEYPVLAVAAAFAEGDTLMEGIGEMRVKESDRINAVCAGLKANGVAVEDTPEFDARARRAPRCRAAARSPRISIIASP